MGAAGGRAMGAAGGGTIGAARGAAGGGTIGAARGAAGGGTIGAAGGGAMAAAGGGTVGAAGAATGAAETVCWGTGTEVGPGSTAARGWAGRTGVSGGAGGAGVGSAASAWTGEAGGAESGAETEWTLAEVTAASATGEFAACVDTFSTLSAEPAASDSAAPTTATAAAEVVTLFAFDTSQGRSRCGPGSLRGVAATCEERAATSLCVANAAPRARASWVSTESNTGIGRASPSGPVTASRSSREPTRCRLSGNQPSPLKIVVSQSTRSAACSRVLVTAVRTEPAPVAMTMTVAVPGSRTHRAVLSCSLPRPTSIAQVWVA